MASIISAGHSTARSQSLRLCRNDWMTHLSVTRGFNHLFNAALAELALDLVSLQYFEKANWWPCSITHFAAQSDTPTSGICLELEPVFNRRQGCAVRLICGISPSRHISDVSNPQAFEKRIPVSLIRAINHLGSSSICIHSFWIVSSASVGMGKRCVFASSSGMNVPLNTLLIDRPCSLMARLITARTDENTRFTDDEDIPRSKR